MSSSPHGPVFKIKSAFWGSSTTIKFKPNEKYFESNEIRLKELKHLLKAKAVLCPGLTIEFQNDNKKDPKIKWFFEDGLKIYFEEVSVCVDLILV